ncbi:MAG: D-glycero-beta-D-manno-heptose 1-phosphate adenylyltransferase [Gemmatales bacterium]|nr:D-glycero-beta-D-manno-heptose 1-phosphate adenylyltransferase [Gemmatales bacterium]MDW8224021.1 D-glycero-beta-D-manno-heptose 1-phosphate adenylyltransferase [Gemmatales bacterium]
MTAELIQLVHKLGQPQVLVVGDLMLDRYVWGNAERISQEAPVVLLRADRREERLGGASSVATLLRALGARVMIAGVVGEDRDGQRVMQLLDELEIDHAAVLVDSSRPTTVKERYVGRAQQRHPQQMLRVDYESRESISQALEQQLREVLRPRIRKADIILVSDYDKGVCTPSLLSWLIAEARVSQRRILADPIRCKSTAENHVYEKYRGCTALTPNRLEASLATGLPTETTAQALAAAEKLLTWLELEACVVTLDKDGMALAHRDGHRLHFPTRPRQVYDITGAGDMVLCMLGLALAAGADYPEAIRLANVAGGLEVEKIGVAPVSRDEILRDLAEAESFIKTCHRSTRASSLPVQKVVPRQELAEIVCRCRQLGYRIVFTNGCFDLLHLGHIRCLEEAKSQGDILIVGLNSDTSVRKLKGSGRPVQSCDARAAILAALEMVDYVVVFDEPTPLELIQLIRPDVLVKGGDYQLHEVVGADFVQSYGGRVHLAKYHAGFSTSSLLRQLSSVPIGQAA